MITRRTVPATLACLVLLLSGRGSAAARPNVLVILTDDQGWGDLSLNGNTNLRTPHIDSLARDGALFERFYVCPVCSPTRAEFLTGRYHPRGGVWSTSTGGERLNLDEKTIGDAFKAAGYATGAFGKWHNGSQWPYHPNARGFDEFYGFASGHWGDYFDPPLEHNGRPTRGEGFITDDLTDHAIAFIEANRDRPFFCYVPFNTPHSPMQVPDRFFEPFKRRELLRRTPAPARGRAHHPRRAGDVREHRLERRPGAAAARRTEAGRRHDRPVLRRQRAEQQPLERRHEGAQGLDRRGGRALAAAGALARADPTRDAGHADRRRDRPAAHPRRAGRGPGRGAASPLDGVSSRAALEKGEA